MLMRSYSWKNLVSFHPLDNENKDYGSIMKQLDKFMKDPATSEMHKQTLREKREQIQLAIVTKKMEKLDKLSNTNNNNDLTS
jgi:hypothetical protein